MLEESRSWPRANRSTRTTLTRPLAAEEPQQGAVTHSHQYHTRSPGHERGRTGGRLNVGGGVIVLGASMVGLVGAALAPTRLSCVLRISASSFCLDAYEVPTGVGGAMGRDCVIVGRPTGT